MFFWLPFSSQGPFIIYELSPRHTELKQHKGQHMKQKPYKSAGVVVSQSLGVAEGLQQWVGLQDDVFDMLQVNRGSC